MQSELVTRHSTGTPRSIRVTYRRLNVRHECRVSATCQERLAAFFSKKLNPAQQKYSAHDRQLLAIYEAVKILVSSLMT
jgi:hypothetical protein